MRRQTLLNLMAQRNIFWDQHDLDALKSLKTFRTVIVSFDDLLSVAVLQFLPLWPESSSGKLCVRVVGSESSSKSFFFDKQNSGTLLRLDMVSLSWTNTSSASFGELRALHLSMCVFVFAVWWNHCGRQHLRVLHHH